MGKSHALLALLLAMALASILTAQASKTIRLAAHGTVTCKPCGGSSKKSYPIEEVVVGLMCNGKLYQKAKTKANGQYFLNPGEKMTASWARSCRVDLLWSPLYKVCETIDTRNPKATLTYEKNMQIYQTPYKLFSVPPLAYTPPCKK